MKKFTRYTWEFIAFLAMFISAFAPFGFSVWAAYILGTEVLSLSQRHAILLALLPIIWIHLLGSYLKKS